MNELEPTNQDNVLEQFKTFEFTNLSTIKGKGVPLNTTSASKEDTFDKDSAFSPEDWEYECGY